MKKRRILTIALTSVLALGLIVAGTLAYLTATVEPITNTFTIGDIVIELDEDLFVPNEAKLYPGAVIPKDPFVTVKGESEDSYVYMLLDNLLNFEFGDDYEDAITLNIDTENWVLVATDGTKTLYRYHESVPYDEDDQKLPDLFTRVTVHEDLTSDDMDDFPALRIILNAFAHQSATLDDYTVADTAAIAHFGLATTEP